MSEKAMSVRMPMPAISLAEMFPVPTSMKGMSVQALEQG